MEERELYSSTDEFLITQVCTILKENSIPYIRKDDGVGSYINVTYGRNTTLEKKIIVNSEVYEKAKNLIEFINSENDYSDIPDELKEFEQEDKKEIKKYNLPMKIWKVFIISFFAMFIVIMLVQLIRFFV